MLQVAFLLLSQEQHGSARQAPELLPSAPVAAASQEDGAWRQAGGLTLAFGWKATQEMGVRSKLKETCSLSLIIWVRVTNSASFLKVQVLYPWGNQNGRSLYTDHSHQCTISLCLKT